MYFVVFFAFQNLMRVFLKILTNFNTTLHPLPTTTSSVQCFQEELKIEKGWEEKKKQENKEGERKESGRSRKAKQGREKSGRKIKSNNEIDGKINSIVPNFSRANRVYVSTFFCTISCSKPGSLERKVRPQKEQTLNCPRHNSTNTKFCYYNNYNLS
ncbi:unnamed protein product [Coffea canephora]|uniref:Dof-type domain-containing protein n=1 Tax=Coffea canephora TaxID=49390 RepID=A0A068VD76_COFCA|nr:unnamed protein product [Coffea canephora]